MGSRFKWLQEDVDILSTNSGRRKMWIITRKWTLGADSHTSILMTKMTNNVNGDDIERVVEICEREAFSITRTSLKLHATSTSLHVNVVE